MGGFFGHFSILILFIALIHTSLGHEDEIVIEPEEAAIPGDGDEVIVPGGDDEQEITFPNPKDGTKKLSFKPPKLSEEEEISPFISEGLKCDSCQAVAVQFHRVFENGHRHTTDQDWRMSEATILEKTEDLCTYPTFEVYGVSAKDGRNRLKGPGVFDEPGIAQMGGKTPFRLAELCLFFLDLEEMVIYEYWARNGRTSWALKELLCIENFDYCRSTPKDEL